MQLGIMKILHLPIFAMLLLAGSCKSHVQDSVVEKLVSDKIITKDNNLVKISESGFARENYFVYELNVNESFETFSNKNSFVKVFEGNMYWRKAIALLREAKVESIVKKLSVGQVRDPLRDIF
jgi:hypothetical protein